MIIAPRRTSKIKRNTESLVNQLVKAVSKLPDKLDSKSLEVQGLYDAIEIDKLSCPYNPRFHKIYSIALRAYNEYKTKFPGRSEMDDFSHINYLPISRTA